ncbi:MAG: hypothetical protein JWM74_4983 [Myxococcaceae bacterium]|nr:hypothetical protein [Myxococcaceae bacterium]
MRFSFGASALLSAWVGIAALAACGGAQPGPSSPNEASKGMPSASESSSAGALPTASGSAASSGAPTTSAGAAVPAPATTAFTGPMKPVAASTIVADLQALGLDPKNLPALGKLEPDKLRKVMRTFTKSLGARCADCHVESDYAAMTPMKKIAQGHWDEFVRKLSTDTGAPVYCDSCHQGRLKLLDRNDKKALGTWMDANFVDHFKRRDGKEHGCETCHGDPFEGKANARFLK